MKSKIAIYLAGSIKKGHENPKESFWTDDDINLLRTSLGQYDVTFLNPAIRTDDLSDPHSVFGRDMLQVFSCHIVFVDARDRRGLGVGAEMMWAKLNTIPVLTWAPKNSHYHKDQATLLGVLVDNFVHPFVDALSDQIVENLTEGAKWIKKFISDPSSIEIKSLDHISAAMQYYKTNQLHRDTPMKQLLETENELTERMNRSCPQFHASL
ncbi:MAG: hypothetical protein K2Y01_11410 [Rhabdochlamydiaceae bacterium]|nr:hypothetical protein [Rhabdochlamydiaceae bacterium]